MTYTCTKSPVALDSLILEIQKSTIVFALDLNSTTCLGDQLTIGFAAALSAVDKATLDAIVLAHAGIPLPQNQVINVRTKFEDTSLTLLVARNKCDIINGSGTMYFKAQTPRETGGGYLKIDTFDIDDYVKIYFEDKDRTIAIANGNLTDLQMQSVIPGYPIVGSYTDDEQPAENQGWYLDPLAMGNNLPPMGECHIDQLGYYGQLPQGLYLKIIITRPNVLTGKVRCDMFWGKRN